MGLFNKRENAYAQAAAVQSIDVDPGDPVLEPIEGVTVERYAELCAGVSAAGLTSEEEVDACAVQQGLAPGGYLRISQAWNARMGTHRALTNRFGALYTAAAADAGPARSRPSGSEPDAVSAGSGDRFAPIEGVDIDTYARVQGLIGKNMIMGPENVESFAAENGIPKAHGRRSCSGGRSGSSSTRRSSSVSAWCSRSTRCRSREVTPSHSPLARSPEPSRRTRRP